MEKKNQIQKSKRARDGRAVERWKTHEGWQLAEELKAVSLRRRSVVSHSTLHYGQLRIELQLYSIQK